jgi:hypothetical protein
VVSIATAGDLLQWHPHGHILLTDGAFSDDGAFHPLETWDGDAIMELFREPAEPSHRLSPEPQQKPRPSREVLRVAEHGEGWECRQNGIDVTP